MGNKYDRVDKRMRELILTIALCDPSQEEQELIDRHSEGRLHQITLFGSEYQVIETVVEWHKPESITQWNTLRIVASRMRKINIPGGF